MTLGEQRVQHFFDSVSSSLTYVVWDSATRDAVVIDPVLDFDVCTQALSQQSLHQVELFVLQNQLRVRWILETHAHADHLSASREAKHLWPRSHWGMASATSVVFENLRAARHWPAHLTLAGLGVDRWLNDGEELLAGTLRVQILATPGHTPSCLTYQIGDSLFVGDLLLMPDAGTGRCDFPGGSAAELYNSVFTKLYTLPDHYKTYVGHDYQPGGRPLSFQSAIGEQKRANIHLQAATAKPAFVSFRETRDKGLTVPRLITPSLDWNLGAHQIVARVEELEP